MTEFLHAADDDAIARAAHVIRAGGLVAFPTETVYGLGAHARNVAAVARIFAAKGRPAFDPLIVHLAHVDQLDEVARDLPSIARELTVFMPGALTLIVHKRSRIPDIVTAGRDTVGVRVPSHPIAHALIAAAGVPIAAPSANTFSRPSATTAQHVLDDLGGRVDVILDGGAATFGIESTIVDVTSHPPRVLRFGAIAPERFAALGFEIDLQPRASTTPADVLAPGMLIKHYSPHASMRFYADPDAPDLHVRLRADAERLIAAGERVGVLIPDDARAIFNGLDVIHAELGSTETQIAARLFAALRELDAAGATVIIARGYRQAGIGTALHERLLRAAEGKMIP